MTREEIETVKNVVNLDKIQWFSRATVNNLLAHIDRLEAELAEVKAENEEMESLEGN